MKYYVVAALLLITAGCDQDKTLPPGEVTDTTTTAAPGQFAAISAGSHHACGRTAAGLVYCWGWAQGIFGGQDPEHEAALRPALTGLPSVDSISSGSGVLCALDEGSALCFGSNEFGQIGTDDPSTMCGAIECIRAPTAVSTSAVVTQIAAGGGHTCAVDDQGAAYCWGYGAYGRLGTGNTLNQRTPQRVVGSIAFRSVAAGGTHSCGLAVSGEAYCWGYGEGGQIGHGFNTTSQLTPARVAGNHQYQSLVSTSSHTCALRLDGAALCWGINATGQLGDGTTTHANVPVRAGTQPFTQLTTGASHTCALAAGGRAYCWGANGEGQLGDGTTTNRLVPTPVTTDLRFLALTAGSNFTCAITTNGMSVCWGLNYRGALGTGSDDPFVATTPVRVAAPI